MLKDKNILVTGISMPMGQAVAMAYAKAGANLILLDDKQGVLAKTDDEIQKETGKPAALYPLSLLQASSDDYLQLSEVLSQEFECLDAVIHCAFHYPTRTPIEHYLVQDWYAIFQVLVHAPYLLTQATLPLLKKSADARIVFTDYDFPRDTAAYWSGFLSAQAALREFVAVLSTEYAHDESLCVDSVTVDKSALPKMQKFFPGGGWPVFEAKSGTDLANYHLLFR